MLSSKPYLTAAANLMLGTCLKDSLWDSPAAASPNSESQAIASTVFSNNRKLNFL